MITDAHLLFSNAQAITADAASTNLIDLGAAADIGVGEPLLIDVAVDEAFNTLTSLNIILETDDNAAFSSATALWTKNFLLASLTAGAKLNLPAIPVGCERYIRLRYDVVGTDPTTGKFTSRIVLNNQRNTPTADAI